MNVLFLYEHIEGGEKIVTEKIYFELKKRNNSSVTRSLLKPLEKTSSFHYFSWLFRSLLFAASEICVKNSLKKISIVYCTTFTAATAALFLRKIYGYKVVFHYHGSRIPVQPTSKLSKVSYFTQYLKLQASLTLHRFVANQSDVCIAPSTFSSKELNTILKINRNWISIPNPIAIPIKFISRTKFTDKKILLTLGRLDPIKNYELSIQALHQLQKKYNHFVLIIGYFSPKNLPEHEYLNKLQRLAKKLTIEKSVVFLENQPSQLLYQLSDIVLAFSHTETFSLIVMEAIANTKHVLTNTMKLKEIADQFENAHFLDTKDPVQLANRIQILAQSEVLSTSSKKMISEYFKIHKIESVVDSLLQHFSA